MRHWCERYLGEPWIAGEHDCWQFFRRVQLEIFHVEIPTSGSAFDPASTLSCARALDASEVHRHGWSEVAQPQDGDAVLMARGAHPTHVGVWVGGDEGAVLHCQRGSGVVMQDSSSLRRHGWGRLQFYRRSAP